MINFKKFKNPAVNIKIDPRFEKLPLKSLFVTSLILNSLFFLLGLAAKLILPPEIPLFYGLPKDSSQLASSLFIVLPTFVALVLTVTNAIISINLESQYLKKTMAFTSLAVTILALVATYKIVFLVGSI